MSHFIICCSGIIILGMPKGQAITQLLQAMQRGLRAEKTIPSSPFLIASAGQTCAQVGSSQCQHTYAAELMLSLRSIKSKLIIDFPRWVSHSLHDSHHSRQPIQREGST